MNILVFGNAGSGKSTFVSSFSSFLRKNKVNVACINLDPATERLKYKFSFDIRKFFHTKYIQRKFNVGPNFAIIKAFELAKKEKIWEDINKVKGEIKLFDLPGQIELLIYHNSLLDIIKNLDGRKVLLFISDVTSIVKEPLSLVTSYLLASSLLFKIDFPLVMLFNKIDLVSDFSVDEIVKKLKEGGGKEYYGYELLKFISTNLLEKKVYISAKRKKNLDEVYDAILESFCSCGDYE